jgi:hypothetical protein
MSEFISVIKTRFSLWKSEIGVIKYVIKYGKELFSFIKDLNKE